MAEDRDGRGAARSQAGSMVLVAACVLTTTLFLAVTRAQGPPCLSRTLLHIACPACGFTRSLVAIWRGDPVASFRYHPLGIPLFGTCVAMVAGWLIGPVRPRVEHAANALVGARSMRAMLGALLGVYAVRLALAAAGNHLFVW